MKRIDARPVAWKRGLLSLLSFILGVSTLATGCGYSLGYRTPPGISTIGVPIFQNSTFPLRREVEHDLTSRVRQEIQTRTQLRLVSSEKADLVLRGNIVEFREDVIVQGRRDRKEESSVVAVVELVLEDHVNRYMKPVRVRTTEPFSPEVGETFQEAGRRAIENLAERIVAAIEYWDDYETAADP